MMPLYVALFNTIFDTGVIPSCWLVGDIVSLNIFYFISAEKGLGISYYNIIYALSLQFTAELNIRHRWR